MASFNSEPLNFPDKETWEKSLREAELYPVLLLLKQLIKGVRMNIDLSKSQFWLTLGMGLVLGYTLAVLLNR